ncbi:MAG: tRNA (guanosine(37)-N1)-methyltransferase TrmD [Paracoccaceae bacterium]
MNKPAKSHGRKAITSSRKPQALMTERPDLKGAWKARVITLLPDAFPGILGASVIGKALDQGLWQLETIDLRPFGQGKHQNVDDTPAGGGAGMVLRADIVGKALTQAAKGTPKNPEKWPVIYLSPRGKPFTQSMAQKFANADGITLLCGRFEGVDERVLEEFNVQEVSLGDFVLTGGEIAAQALIDATVRLIPRVLGNQASTVEESFNDGLLEHPHYTKPATWQGRDIPDVLLSGHHGHIADWRRAMAERLTKQRRPDLWRAYCESHNLDPGEDTEQ